MKQYTTAALLLAAVTPAFGQSVPATTSRPLAVGDVTIEQSAGFSWFSPGGKLGDVTHRRVYFTGLRRTWLEAAAERFAIAYSVELVPLAIVERTQPNAQTCWMRESGERVCRRDWSARVAVGAGGSPIGAKMYYNRAGRWRAHVGGGAGALLFSSEVPIYGSRHFNFTVEFGGGVELDMGLDRALSIAYKFHHISNAGTGAFNPGLDANVISVGLVKRGRRTN